MNAKPILRGLVLLLLVAGALYLYGRSDSVPPGPTVSAPGGLTADSPSAAGGDRAIVDAFAEHRSGVMVESAGVVEKILRDDLQGSRHQRFILRTEVNHTLLISHNIDVAPRIPLAEGDTVHFRGQYEWNERGGVVHWTHHDPAGRHPGGWLRHRGALYE